MNFIKEIQSIKNELGNKAIIAAHHYQDPEIVKLADFLGDSYKLAVDCSKVRSEFIIFCGVYFMAEAADILSSSDQKVIIPNISARCPMADQINLNQAEKAFQKIAERTKKEIAPVVYMNSNADVKSFCGEKGGSVCTSSNAAKIVKHYVEKDKIVFFSPDYNLGINTANDLNLKDDEILKITKDYELTGDPKNAKIVLWDGYCYVHKRFTVGDIENLRRKYAKIKIIVHPECDEEVVKNSDISGSTAKIYNEIKKSPAGSVWGVGTEYHFVQRIADEFSGKIIVPLRNSICKNMAKITPENLLKSLKAIQSNVQNNEALEGIVQVEKSIKDGAKKALKKMIEIVEM
ncbi:MAG: quinolinate synthase NadA [Candidatus Cloacimonetes bacterium]|nr:quinolinate synthase NadA [Candidatus Cloacimonadota bacterium]MCF7813215.1 quinolinate synthase NadA [Candidatus Cloacimonadota bacterium]MCF7867414.1 quinolinate synthase NadA [Candidatus Cloacimonadota bacterium]MCF7882954.1 quinolinate synthase NadA [Candidatus Cloacimonadota bacterium]